MLLLGKILIYIYIAYIGFILLAFLKYWLYDGLCYKSAFAEVVNEYCN
jgi:hypothetical protein